VDTTNNIISKHNVTTKINGSHELLSQGNCNHQQKEITTMKGMNFWSLKQSLKTILADRDPSAVGHLKQMQI